MSVESQLNSNSRAYQCASEIHEATNSRIYKRNVPSSTLQPYLNVRPVMTKYSIMPIVDPRRMVATPFQQVPVYNPQSVFNPGNTVSPWSGYATSVNIESELRNQIYALQSCSQAVYVPGSQSDLYQNPTFAQNIKQQPFELLFEEPKFDSFNPNPNHLGKDNFNNCTRQQVVDLTGSKCGPNIKQTQGNHTVSVLYKKN